MTDQPLIEQFPELVAIDFCQHAFIKRIPGLDVSSEKKEALNRLETLHRKIRASLGMNDWPLVTADQVHGREIAIIESLQSDQHLAGIDGFITKQPGIALGVHVADCCAVYIMDCSSRAIGLVHSGRKGTELDIVGSTIEQMKARFGSDPSSLIIQLSPCVRPPHYEVDFASKIIEQCHARGVRRVHDVGVCTACNLDQYYSYRAEKGKTGRMLALIGLKL